MARARCNLVSCVCRQVKGRFLLSSLSMVDVGRSSCATCLKVSLPSNCCALSRQHLRQRVSPRGISNTVASENEGGGWPGTYQDLSRAADYLRELAPRYHLDLKQSVAV